MKYRLKKLHLTDVSLMNDMNVRQALEELWQEESPIKKKLFSKKHRANKNSKHYKYSGNLTGHKMAAITMNQDRLKESRELNTSKLARQ